MRPTNHVSYIKVWLPWILGIMAALMLLQVAKLAVKRYSILQEIKAHERDVAAGESRRLELTELLKYVESPTYSEEQARLKFGLAKPGEKLAIVPDSGGLNKNNSKPAADGVPADNDVNESNYIKWWNYFFR